MYIRVLALSVLAFLLFVTPRCAASSANCASFSDDVTTIKCQFSSTVTAATFDFGIDGVITFQFDTVLASFELDVQAVEDAPFTFTGPDFPVGTACIPYDGAGGNGGICVRYNVTGANGGPVPVKGVNFRGLITVLLNYNSFPIVGIPAFGHAPGDTTTAAFSEDILTFYVDPKAPAFTTFGDPAMGGKTPNISSFEGFKKPFANGAQGAAVCFPGVTAVPQDSASGNNPIFEVSFKLAATVANCTSGPFLRDKTATLSVGTTDPNNINNVVPTTLVNGGDSNKFHFDNKNGANVQNVNTNKLPSGTYNVTVISTLFSPVNTTFIIP